MEIKLVIWDLDHTFWTNTLDEQEVIPVQANIDIIRKLNDHGIVNSICSKNNFDRAKNKLVEFGVWDEFTMSSIAWSSKGTMIKSIMDSFALRAENILFIDDNEMNLQEAAFYNPGLLTFNYCTGDVISTLHEVIQKAKPDNRKRFNQYKILEKKNEDKAKHDDNTEFLKQSGIKINISYDCTPHIDRIEELINRTNQLNYTKLRMDKEQISMLFANLEYSNFSVFVTDKYGDYGLAGFVSLHKSTNKIYHFVFSCRILNMGVENYIWAKLNYPSVTINGEVAVPLSKDASAAWISEANSVTEKILEKTASKVLLIGGCDLSQMHHYLKVHARVDTHFNYPSRKYQSDIHRDGINFIHAAMYFSGEEKEIIFKEFPLAEQDFFHVPDFAEYDIIIYSPLIDYVQSEYSFNENNKIKISYGDFTDVTETMSVEQSEFRTMGVPDDLIKRFCSKWNTSGGISPLDFISKLNTVFQSFKGTLFLINGAEKYYPEYHKKYIPRHQLMNEHLRMFAQTRPNSFVIDVDNLLNSSDSFLDSIRHYKREVYYQMAEIITAKMNSLNIIPNKLNMENKQQSITSAPVFIVLKLEGEPNYKFRYYYSLNAGQETDLAGLENLFNQDSEFILNNIELNGYQQVLSRQKEIFDGINQKFNSVQDIKIDSQSFPEIISYDGISLWQFITGVTYASRPQEVIEIIEYFSNLIKSVSSNKIIFFGNIEESHKAVIELIAAAYNKVVDFRIVKRNSPVQSAPAVSAVEAGNRAAIREYYSASYKENISAGNQDKVLLISYPSAVNKSKEGIYTDRYYDSFRSYFAENTLEAIRVEIPYYDSIKGCKKDYIDRISTTKVSGYSNLLFDQYLSNEILEEAEQYRSTLTNKFNQYSNDPEFQKAFSWKGISFFTPIYTYWKHLFTDFLVNDCIVSLLIARKLLAVLKPKAIMLTYEVGQYARALIIEAQRANIISVGMQHGFIFKEHEYYLEKNQSNLPDTLKGFYGYIAPTITLLYGKYHKQVLSQVGEYPPESLQVIGDWRLMDKSYLKNKNNRVLQKLKNVWFPNTTKKIALLLTSGLSQGIAQEIVKNLSPDEYVILIKMHPDGKNQALLESIFTQAGFEIVFINSYLYESISIADVVFTSVYSSVCLEAMAFGKIPIYKNDYDAGYTVPWRPLMTDILNCNDINNEISEAKLLSVNSLLDNCGVNPDLTESQFNIKLKDAFAAAEEIIQRSMNTQKITGFHEGNQNTVSVVIPAYNRAHLIGRAIESIQNQTIPVDEIIIADDASTDNTIEVINYYKRKDSRIVYKRLPQNKGAQAARNLGIQSASGKWIAFLDSDDIWLPKRIELSLNKALETNRSANYCNYIRRQNDVEVLVNPGIYNGNVSAQILESSFVSFPGLFLKRECFEIINYLDENIISWQEWDTSIRLSQQFEFDYIDEPGFVWIWHDGETISKDMKRDALGVVQIISKHTGLFLNKAGAPTVRKHLNYALSKLTNTQDPAILQLRKKVENVLLQLGQG